MNALPSFDKPLTRLNQNRAQELRHILKYLRSSGIPSWNTGTLQIHCKNLGGKRVYEHAKAHYKGDLPAMIREILPEEEAHQLIALYKPREDTIDECLLGCFTPDPEGLAALVEETRDFFEKVLEITLTTDEADEVKDWFSTQTNKKPKQGIFLRSNISASGLEVYYYEQSDHSI